MNGARTGAAIREAREALRELEASALAGVAENLMRVCEAQARVLKDLEAMRHEEWLTPEQARQVVQEKGRSWERIAPHLPRRYISPRTIRYPRSLLDAALYAADSPERSLMTRNNDKKKSRQDGDEDVSGGLRSLRNALK